jgi:hypothetical protein
MKLTELSFRHLKKIFFGILLCWLGVAHAVVPMSDTDLAQVSGQALFDTTKSTNGSGITFYTIGLDAALAMNTNIQNMQLGCGGTNGSGDCDIDVQRFSVSGSPGVNGCPSSGSVASCDAILTRPQITLAIANDGTPQRQVIGFQLGAQNIAGQLGFGSFNKFSGYLSATTNVTMQAANNVAVTCGTGSCTGTTQTDCNATTCNGSGGFGFVSGGFTANGQNQFGFTGTQSLGLNDDYACALLVCAAFDSLTVNIGQQTATAPVLVSGIRQSQAQISGLNLGTLVENVANSMSVNNSNGLPAGLINLILPLIRTNMELSIENQMGAALACNQTSNFNTCPGITPQTGSACTNSSYNCVGTSNSETTQAANLNKYIMPYNVSNLHVTDVNSSNFGLSFESQAVQWPGYVAAVNKGWALYMPNAFTLSINQPLSTFTNNIVSGAASAGNIAQLAGPPQNCYGSYTFY